MGIIWTPKLIKPPLGTPLNKSDPINKGLICSLLMNEKVGSTILDSSGNGNRGTITNAIWSPGKFGSSLSFDGNSDYVTISGKATIIPYYTITLWFKPVDNNASTPYLFYFAGLGKVKAWACRWNNDDISRFAADSDGPNIELSSFALLSDRWYFFTGINSNTGLKYYLNGQLVKSHAQVCRPIVINGTKIGSDISNNNSFNGQIENFCVWNRALSPSEIQRLYRDPFCGYGRPMIELFSVSAGGGGADYTETINDGIGITDALGKVASVLRTLTESLGITDSTTKTSIAIRTISEALGITDEIVKSEAKVISDSLGITDMADKTSVSVRTLSETLGITDSVVRTALVLRAISETIGMTDIANQLSEITRVLSDTIGITDDITKTVSVLRTISDLLGITDSITRLWVIIRTISDDIGITDETIIEGIGAVVKVINDTIGISDNASKVVTALRTLSEQVGMSDAIARVFIISRIITDSEGITDGIALDRVMTISNALGISDSVTKLINFVRTNNDDIGILDSIVKVTVALRTINDVVGISDDVTESLGGLVKAAWAFMMLKKHK